MSGQALTVVVEGSLRAVLRNRIAVEQRQQRDLFAHGLKLRGNGKRHEAAKRPAEQVVRSMRLDAPYEAQIVLCHLIDGAGTSCPLRQIARLKPVDRMLGRNMPDELGIGPTEAAGIVDAEQRQLTAGW